MLKYNHYVPIVSRAISSPSVIKIHVLCFRIAHLSLRMALPCHASLLFYVKNIDFTRLFFVWAKSSTTHKV
jgi:hypothetical protein